ncbi:FACT complex subunit SPT16-like [Lycium ferocissimum]|uniref:FACT complex subunit SPT16-like n=1 Tax=Lycium ferocissimum TaxID=112874 RepID=UPI002815D3E8|nr:FACT complex subunit SPT16-like [Lycium ferocissimum]
MTTELFKKRLNTFYINWIQHKKQLWGNSDVVVIQTPPKIAKFSNPKSSCFLLWLLGDDFTDTTIVFTPYGIYFFCTHKNFSKLREFCACATLIQNIPTSVQLKDKNDDGFLIIDATIRDTKNIRNEKVYVDADKEWPFVVGYVEGEYPKSKLILNCINELEPTKYQATTVNSGLDALLNIADEQSIGPSACMDEKLVSLIDSDLEHKLQLDVANSQSKLEENKIFLDGRSDNSVPSTSVVGASATIEDYSIQYDFTGSCRKDSVVLDYNNDDWVLVEGKEGQGRKVPHRISWKRWIMDKTAKSFGLRDKGKIKASSY